MMVRLGLALLILVFCSPAALPDDAAGLRQVHEVAQSRPLPDGAPRASDVIMRSLRLRMGKGESERDTFRALGDFHVSRLEWAYIRDADFITRCREKGVLFGGAASSAMSHVIMPMGDSDYAGLSCVNLRGEPVVPTWKRTWRPPGNWWMCVNNPTLERRYTEYLKSYLDAGARVMQRDEPWGNYRAVDWGGCFCDRCMKEFRSYLAESNTAEERTAMGIADIDTFNYREFLRQRDAPVGDAFKRYDGGELKKRLRDFQMEATIAFHKRTRQAVNEHAGRRVAFSCNNGCHRWTPIELLFDWCFGELSFSHARPEFIHDCMREATALERRQVITMPKKRDQNDPEGWCRLTRQTIAMAYACGGHCMVPWDVYMPGDAPRYFGTPDQYADLFGFIRANAKYLDGYEYAGAWGPGIECDLCGETTPLQVQGGERLCAVLRARPGRRDAPVVIHVVDWAANPKPFRISLEPGAFFGGRPMKLKLLRPSDYDKTQHARAEETQQYARLVETVDLGGGYDTSFSLPAARPWGLLVIEPDDSVSEGVWQPTIRVEQSDFYRETLIVHLATASEGATLQYTTDGSHPTATSPRYRGGIELSESATLHCVAISPAGQASTVVSAKFIRNVDAPKPTKPDSPALRDALKLWLSAGSLEVPGGSAVTRWPAAVGPDAIARPHNAPGGIVTQAPTLAAAVANGRPAVRFDGVDDSIAIEGFANQYLAGKAFTVFMVTASGDDRFGMCGNGIWGSGGTPRLYMQRGAFRYDELQRFVSLHPADEGLTISVFMHDGRETIWAGTNGVVSEPVSGLPAVSEFGGGNLAIPFWSGNENCAGHMAEIIVFDRMLAPAERAGVEAYLAGQYSIQCVRRWE